MRLLGALICWWTGKHKRGQFVRGNQLADPLNPFRFFACPRCGRTTRYKVKHEPENEGTPTDGSPSLREAL